MGKRHCEVCDLDFAPDMMASGKRCKGCHRAALRAARIQKTYSITEQSYQELLAYQGGSCAICQRAKGVRKRLSVDHRHRCCNGPVSCGECVSGLLCSTCNKFLGHIRDSIEAGYRLAHYLESPPAEKLWGGKRGA